MALRIGSITLESPLILAPMTRVTDLPFRAICRSMGASLVTTEMVSAEGLVRGALATRRLLVSDGSDRPLAVQLFGASPRILAQAARICQEEGADLVDLNMGCPVPQVVGRGAGAALLRDLPLAAAILEAMRRNLRIPLTVKIRSGWTPQQGVVLELARIALECGVDAVTLHPRARSESYAQPARWDLVKLLVQNCSLPVIGNGDVCTPKDALAMLQDTGCQGVMIGRAAMGNPWIFQHAASLLSGQVPPAKPGPGEIWRVLDLHMEGIASYYGAQGGLQSARFHASRYTRGIAGSARMRQALNGARSLGELRGMLHDFLAMSSLVSDPG